MAETPLVRLVVLGPGRQVYGTRALIAGDQFEMAREYADVLIRLGKAKLADEKPPEPEKYVEPEQPRTDELQNLRAEADRIGLAWDGRWGVIRLKHEISQAKSA
jgi:hypothetical protein